MKLETMVSTMPTALDIWIIAFCLIKAFDRDIPWWAWLFFALELLCLLGRWGKE